VEQNGKIEQIMKEMDPDLQETPQTGDMVSEFDDGHFSEFLIDMCHFR
jgi:hypothetical protein